MPEITVYVPDNSVKMGYRSLFREMAEEVRTSKWLAWQLFKRDFKVIYQQSILGILWILIPPLIVNRSFTLYLISGAAMVVNANPLLKSVAKEVPS